MCVGLKIYHLRGVRTNAARNSAKHSRSASGSARCLLRGVSTNSRSSFTAQGVQKPLANLTNAYPYGRFSGEVSSSRGSISSALKPIFGREGGA